MVEIKVKKLHSDAIIPNYAHPGDAGMDIYSNEDIIIYPKERRAVKTGISIQLPEGYVALVWDKSGMAFNFGLTTLAGVMDSGYRGEYQITILNTTTSPYEVKKGQKIAQILIQPIEHAEVIETQELEDSSRGDGGFGSTGLTQGKVTCEETGGVIRNEL